MLMSPHSGLGQLEGHGGWRHVSHDMDHREGAGKVIQARSMPPGRVCPSPLRDELKRPTESNTRGREGECIDEPVNGLSSCDVTAPINHNSCRCWVQSVNIPSITYYPFSALQVKPDCSKNK